MPELEMEDEGRKDGGEVAPSIISVHPLEESVVVAIGSELRAFDLVGSKAVNLLDPEGPAHSDSIRSICFGAKGLIFASAGDDKIVKIWKVDSWQCIRTVCSEKRVSAVAVNHDGSFVCFSDKFGVVWVVDMDVECQGAVDKKASPLLGHYCSIITSLEFSPDGRFIASADRDFKIRITTFPKYPLKGAHEIQSFCLGHTDFVSCLAFIHPLDYAGRFLLSGGGDSTVRLWDYLSGSLLDTCEVVSKVSLPISAAYLKCLPLKLSQGRSDSIMEEDCSVVTSLSVSHNGSSVVVVVQSFRGVFLLSFNFSTKTLAVARVLPMQENFIPTSIGISNLADNLWMVMGASTAHSSDRDTFPVRVKVMSGLQQYCSSTNSRDPVVVQDDEVPGGRELLQKLQGSLDVDKDGEALLMAAESIKTAIRNLLIKKQYSVEKREFRKKSRNDRKLKQ